MNTNNSQNKFIGYGKGIGGVICDVGGKAKGNQDSAFFGDLDIVSAVGANDTESFSGEIILALVCDGVSASQKGEKGSSFAIRTLSSKITQYLLTNNIQLSQIQQVINHLIIETNQELLEKYKDLIESGKVPKTTLVGVLVIGQWLWVFNIGDSRAYLVRDGQIGQISIDHIGTGATHEITQALGEVNVQPAIQVYNWAYIDHASTKKAFQKEYYCLICSDGLTDLVKPNEIQTVLSQQDINIQEKAQKLFQMSKDRKIDDNVSIVAIDLAKYLSRLSPIQIIKLSF